MNAQRSLSLAATVDEVNESFFFGRSLPLATRRKVATWIGGRQGLAGSYAGMPAPTQQDFAEGIRVFTGESVPSRVGTAHVLGEEACRALILLDAADSPAAVAECRHAAPGCARIVAGPSDGGDRFARRRRALAERILSKA
jgi:hypothetical protein